MTPLKLTAASLSETLQINRGNVFKRAQKESWPFEEVSVKGGKQKLFPFASLPAAVQIAVQKRQRDDAADASPTHEAHAGALPSGGSVSATLPPTGIAGADPLLLSNSKSQSKNVLPQWADDIATARTDLVYLYIKARDVSNKKTKDKIAKEFLTAYNSGLAWPKLFEALKKVSRSTLERWRKDLAESNHDYHVLAPRWGGNAGNCKLTSDEQNVLLAQVLHQNKRKIATCVEYTKDILRGRGLPSPSSPATMRRYLDKFKEQHLDIWVINREGEKALVDKVLPYIERDDSLIEVGDVLVADGKRCNFFADNPWTGKKCRPLLVGFFDWKSRILVGFAIGLQENTQLISAALRNAIIGLGKTPKVVLLDNGKAFKGKVFTGDVDLEQAGLLGMYARLGIETTFAWPYNARSKPIERFFGTLGDSFERYLPSFTGACIEDRPASLRRNEKFMQKMNPENIPTIPQVGQALSKWSEFYGHKTHPTIKNKTRAEVFAEGCGPGVNVPDLNFLMMDIKLKNIRQNGINFLGANYYDEALYGLREQVVIRYDFNDVSSLQVYTKGGEFICAATRVEKVHPQARILGGPKDVETLKREIGKAKKLKKRTLGIAKDSLDIHGDTNILNAIDFSKMPQDLPGKIEQIENQHAAESEGDSLPSGRTGKGETVPACEGNPSSPERKQAAPVVPLFLTATDRYFWLADEAEVRDLDEEEKQFICEYEKTDDYAVMGGGKS